jgi:AraC family transcriptional regulator, transcriptional activator of pobA
MHNQLLDVSIPKYSLQEVSANGNCLFEVVESKGEQNRQHPSIFLAPHRKDYYHLAFVKDGSSRHWVDMTPYVLKPDTFYFSVPHQVHVKEQAKPLVGTLLCFTDEFLTIEENQFLKQLPLVQNLHNGHELELSAKDVEFIEDIFGKIATEYKQKQDWRNSMLLAYLRVLLIYVSRLYTVQFVNNEALEERMLLNKFRSLIEEQYLQLHDVTAYANLLFISPGHLSEVVKQQSGKTAIEHIHERLMLEGKRLLFHTENSIKEIAFQLGFEDASYFNRFFKRLSSQTPLEYRKTTREMYH